jgi:hypothetical protein
VSWRDLTTAAGGLLLISYGAFSVMNGRIVTKPGSTAVTLEQQPVLFWIAACLVLGCGSFVFAYGVMKAGGWARGITDQVDRWIGRGGST